MDAFEQIIGQLLTENGYWVRHSVKVDLTKQEKRDIGKPSAPRPEIDLAAYRPATNTLVLIEVKSYLDSGGVVFKSVATETTVQEGRYKLLTSENYRRIVKNRLVSDWVKKGHLPDGVQVSYGLVAGKVYQNKEAELRVYFDSKAWLFWGPSDIKEKLQGLVKNGYENNAVTIAAKLLSR